MILKLKSSITILLFLILTNVLQAQVTVTVTNPGNATPSLAASYASLANAISALNTVTSVSGPITLTCSSGNETAPIGGYVIQYTASTSLVNNIVINGSGCILTSSSTLTVGSINDGIIRVLGSDYLTIQNFILQENASNTVTTAASNNMTEWGIALLYLTPTNGAQNCTIVNNTITLNRLYQNSFGIYSNSTHDLLSPTIAATASSPSGSNSNLKIYSNIISNVNRGILVIGPLANANNNTGIDIGGSSISTGNIITNFGRSNAYSAYPNIGVGVDGVFVRYSTGVNIAFNSVTSSSGGTIAGNLRGIYMPSFSGSLSGTITTSISNNTISVVSGSSTGNVDGISIETNTSNATSSIQINNNNFTACSHSVSSSGNVNAIISGMNALNTTINNNLFTNLSFVSTGTIILINNSITIPAGGSQTISGNSIVTGLNKTSTFGTLRFIYDNGSSITATKNWSNNNFSNITVAQSSIIEGIVDNDGGFINHNINNNILRNITASSGSVTGIISNFGGDDGGDGNLISNNTIENITSAGVLTGIRLPNSSSNSKVIQNTITGLTTTGSSLTGILSESLDLSLIQKNKICNLQMSNAGGTLQGITINTSTNTIVSNNLIGDLRAPISNTTNAISGIGINSFGSSEIYFNTIHLSASSSASTFGTSAISVSSNSTFTLRNNILHNTSVPNGVGLTVALRKIGTALTGYNTLSNNNLFFAGTPGANRLIYYDGTNSDQTLAAFKTRVTPREQVSVTENLLTAPAFINTSCGTTSFLHINSAVSTLAYRSATNIAGITDDFDGNPRHPSTPDIGADEFSSNGSDFNAPVIAYAPLSNICNSGLVNQTLSALISDSSGVPTTGSNVPRIYFKTNLNGAYTSLPGALISGNGQSGNWNFNFSVNVIVGDTVYYYVIAQDSVPVPPVNIISNPSTGLLATNVNTVTNHPSSPSFFVVGSIMSGDYTVGPGGNFNNITTAVRNYNISCLSGPVRFILTSLTYTSETFPITILKNPYASAINTLTIQPDASNLIATTISGNSATTIFKLLGAQHVIINGSKNNTNSRDLTIENSLNANLNGTIWLASAGNGMGVNNCAIKNCNISGGAIQNFSTNITYGIILSGNTTIITPGADNDNNLFDNNYILRVNHGIALLGSSLDSDSGNVISNNLIGPPSFGPDEIGNVGILLSNQNGTIVKKNEVRFVGGLGTTSPTSTSMGIGIGTAQGPALTLLSSKITNAMVTENNIHDVINENTYSAVGIELAAVNTSATNNVIANNFVSNIRANGTVTDQCLGIFIASGNGDKVVFNSVYLSGDMDPSGTISADQSADGVRIAGSALNLNFKNNIIKNNVNCNNANVVNFAFVVSSTSYSWGTGGCNNNCYYAPVSNLVVRPFAFGTTGSMTVVPTLADWRTYFSGTQDAASVEAEPHFISTSDLHIHPTQFTLVEKGASPISGITKDYDDQQRHLVRPDIGADEGDFTGNAYNDLKAMSFESAFSIGNGSVGVPALPRVKFTNLSVVNLNNVPFRCKVIGPLPLTTLAYDQMVTLPVVSAADTFIIDFPSLTLADTGSYQVFAFAEQPGDDSLANDTIQLAYHVYVPMNGIYTIDNNIMTSSGDYHSLKSALDDIQLRGCNGPVRFELIDSIYINETFPYTINEWNGASAVNNLTIHDSIGNAWILGSTGGVFNIFGADHIVFDHLKVKANPIEAGILFHFKNAASYNTIRNCSIHGNDSTGGATLIAFTSSDTGSVGCNYNIIENNLFDNTVSIGNYPGPIIYGAAFASSPVIGTIIRNNTIVGFKREAIHLSSGVYDSEISGNSISCPVAQSSELVAIFCSGLRATVSNNVISNLSVTANIYNVHGIEVLGSNLTDYHLVKNNFVSINTSFAYQIRGIYVNNRTKVYNNTVSVSGTAASVISGAIVLTGSQNDIRNNIFYSGSNQLYAYYTLNSLNQIGRHNCFYSPGSNLFSIHNTLPMSLPDFQAYTSLELTSINRLPLFTSATDLHLLPTGNDSLANRAEVLATISNDLDGQIRNGCPDIGADEFDFSGAYYIDNDSDSYGSSIANATYFCDNNPPSGYIIDHTDCNDAIADIHPDAVELCGNNRDDNCNAVPDENCSLTLNLKLYMEGLHNVQSFMNPVLFNSSLNPYDAVSDSITVEFHEVQVPYNNVYFNTVLLYNNGLASVTYPLSMVGGNYYIAIRNRNSVEIWSKLPITLGTNTSIDFTQ